MNTDVIYRQSALNFRCKCYDETLGLLSVFFPQTFVLKHYTTLFHHRDFHPKLGTLCVSEDNLTLGYKKIGPCSGGGTF